MTIEDKLKIFKETGALQEGHFLLSSGLHSNIYFQCALVLQYPKYSTLFCSEIAEHFSQLDFSTVISPAIGGILVGQEVARLLNRRAIFTERENGKMKLRRGFTLTQGEKVLICEDVVTTSKSSMEVKSLVESYGAKVVGLSAIVDRTSGKVTFDLPFFATMKIDVDTYSPENCPLCLEKIPIIKPGSRK